MATLVPLLWFYEVGNGLLMACRRTRISLDQVDNFPTRLKALPIEAAQLTPSEILELPALAQATASRITTRHISRSLCDMKEILRKQGHPLSHHLIRTFRLSLGSRAVPEYCSGADCPSKNQIVTVKEDSGIVPGLGWPKR